MHTMGIDFPGAIVCSTVDAVHRLVGEVVQEHRHAPADVLHVAPVCGWQAKNQVGLALSNGVPVGHCNEARVGKGVPRQVRISQEKGNGSLTE